MKIYTTLRAVKTIMGNYNEGKDCAELFDYINNRNDYDDAFAIFLFYHNFAEVLPIPSHITGAWKGISYAETVKIMEEKHYDRLVQIYAYMNTHALYLNENHSSQKEGRPGVPFYIMDMNPIISSYLQFSNSELRVSCTPQTYKAICGTEPITDSRSIIKEYLNTLVTIMLAGSRVNSITASIPFDFKFGDIDSKVTTSFNAGNYDNIPIHNLTALYGWSKVTGQRANCENIATIFK